MLFKPWNRTKLNPIARALWLALITGTFACNALAVDTVSVNIKEIVSTDKEPKAEDVKPETEDSKEVISQEGQQVETAGSAIDFNMDVLDVKDRSNIDLTQFSRGGFIMPGEYRMVVHVNQSDLPEQVIHFIVPPDDAKGSLACITPALVASLGLTEASLKKTSYWNNGECLSYASIPGMTVRGDLSSASLYISIPQAWLEYTAPNWEPASRWDNGVAGMLFDYNFNATQTSQKGSEGTNITGNGTSGANIGPWRLRADWQETHTSGSGYGPARDQWDWNRFYLFRAVTSLRSKLVLGENDLDSGIFDGFRFTGASLSSDDNQLPPNLRGYAPEVVGLAKTNAKVIVSQNGRVIYQTQVAPGPFRIQDLNDAVSGKLDVRVEEQDGSIQTFQMNTASIPYLTRPGLVRFKFSTGRPSDTKHHVSGETFGAGEFSWGVSNGWSLYGGSIGSQGYQSVALGIGRDLMFLGAISFDITQSRAELWDNTIRKGGSYRLSYSKRFDDYDSQITFAGYRFSERNFMSMTDYLDVQSQGYVPEGTNKELYTITFNKQFRDQHLSAYVNYSHQTYWNRPVNDRWSTTLSTYFDIGDWKNISLSLTGYKTKYQNSNDTGAYMGLSIPWGTNSTLGYDTQTGRDGSNNVSWYDRLDSNNTYRISAGANNAGRANLSGYYSHAGDSLNSTVSASYREGSYRTLGASVQGGVTATLHGIATHRINTFGGTRLMVDTGGVNDVPVKGNGADVGSNIFGKAVVSDVSSYYRSTASVDVAHMNDHTDVSNPVAQLTLTEGAIGFRKFDVVSGQKLMAFVRLADGSAPPFGASVLRDGREVGIVNDDGSIWMTGVVPDIQMELRYNGERQCMITIPKELPDEQEAGATLLLPCIREKE